MPKIVPAILTDDSQSLESMVRTAETFADFFQIDIMDGAFVPSLSVGAADIERAGPRKNYEVHLMVNSPGERLGEFVLDGCSRIIFHYESTKNPRHTAQLIRNAGLFAGIALNPETPPGKAKDVLSVVDTVLIMTVNPGFYGSPFLPDCMKKIEMVRSICPDARIGIDGGINELTITRALSFPLDFICVGSAIFRDRNPAKMFRSLQEKAGQP